MVTVLVGWKEGFRSALAWLCAAPARTKVATRAAVRTPYGVPVPRAQAAPGKAVSTRRTPQADRESVLARLHSTRWPADRTTISPFGECGPEATRDWRITM